MELVPKCAGCRGDELLGQVCGCGARLCAPCARDHCRDLPLVEAALVASSSSSSSSSG